MSAAIFCAKCAMWTELDTRCACRTDEPLSNLVHVVAIASQLAAPRIRRGEGPYEVTAEEMSEASAIARSEVEA